MGGLLALFLIGYILYRTRGHWREFAAIMTVAALVIWVGRIIIGLTLVIFGAAALAYLFSL